MAVQGELWIIDVSQSVDLDHPRALDFLREDAAHVNSYFQRAGVATLTTRELFEFAVDPNINAGNINEAVEALIQVSSSRPAATGEDEIAAKVCSAAITITSCFSPIDGEICSPDNLECRAKGKCCQQRLQTDAPVTIGYWQSCPSVGCRVSARTQPLGRDGTIPCRFFMRHIYPGA